MQDSVDLPVGATITPDELTVTTLFGEVEVSGSGDVEAYDLKTEKAELKIAGSGSIGISVEKEIIARVSGSGDIKYKGQPRIEDIKVSGSGQISSY